jgi:ribosomal protein S18 acetylase RimI-like enzyme
MLLLDEFDGIRYGLLAHEDVAEMARVIGQVFSRSDPLGVAIGMKAEDIEAFVLVFGTKAVAEGLTVVARARSGALVGAMFSDDFGTPPPDLDALPVSFAPVGALLERLDEEYRRTRSIGEGSHAHFNMLAIVPELSGRCIAQKLVELGMENAARRGYGFAVTEANGPISQHIFRKLGFQQRHLVSYKDFRFNDRPVFAAIESTRGIMLMEADIQSQLGA